MSSGRGLQVEESVGCWAETTMTGRQEESFSNKGQHKYKPSITKGRNTSDRISLEHRRTTSVLSSHLRFFAWICRCFAMGIRNRTHLDPWVYQSTQNRSSYWLYNKAPIYKTIVCIQATASHATLGSSICLCTISVTLVDDTGTECLPERLQYDMVNAPELWRYIGPQVATQTTRKVNSDSNKSLILTCRMW